MSECWSDLDILSLRDVRLRCVIGTEPEEQRQPQWITLTIDLGVDVREGALEDSLSKTVDYSEVHQRVTQLVENSRFQLIEALAERVAGVCLETRGVRLVRVRLEKTYEGRPVMRGVGAAVVDLCRDRQGRANRKE